MVPKSLKDLLVTKQLHLSFRRPRWSFKTFSRFILHCFGIYPELNYAPASLEIPSFDRDVDTWVADITNVGLLNHERIPGVKVTKFYHMKDTSGLQHEYFVAEVYHSSYGGRQYIRIERNAGQTPPQSGSPVLSSVSSLLDSLFPREAVDTAAHFPSFPDGDKILRTATVTGANIRLLDIALASKVVHANRTMHKLLGSEGAQCFWFADAIFSIVASHFGAVEDAVQVFEHKDLQIMVKGKYLQHAFTEEWKLKQLVDVEEHSNAAGKMGRIPIYKRRKENIAKLLELYREELAEFEENVRFLLLLLRESNHFV